MKQDIASFLSDNPGLSLDAADLFNPEALSQYRWPENTDHKVLLQSLRIRQRMLKVYPDENVAAALESLGLHSAHHIASLDEHIFARKVRPSLATLDGVEDPAILAATLYSNAAHIRRASFELALAKPRTMDFAVADPSGEGTHPDFQQNIPDYQGLFGPIITCDCDDCQSIFGPAAYFTDLMRVVSEYIAAPLETLFTLQYRRPDLWTLPLNCAAAETELSYLDIVNAVLQQHLKVNYTNGADPMQVIAGEVYPFTAPFNASLLTIRSAMQELGVPLYALYELLETNAPAAAAEALQLSPEQLQLVTGAKEVTLAQLYGFHDTSLTDTDLCESLSQQRIFLQQTGLSPHELEALVYQNLDRQQQQQRTGGYCLNTAEGSTSNNSTTGEVSLPQLLDDFSIEMWLYPNSLPTSEQNRSNLLAKTYAGEFAITINYANYGGGPVPAGTVSFYYGNAQDQCNNYSSTQTYYGAMTSTGLNLQQWNHLAITRKAATGQVYIYLNGIQAAVSNPTNYKALASPTNCPIIIGEGYTNVPFDGLISQVRIWNSVLDADQVAAGMNAPVSVSQYPDLIAYWPLNETGGNIAYDLSPNDNDATNGSAILFEYNALLPIPTAADVSGPLMSMFFLNRVLGNGQYLALRSGDLSAQEPARLVILTGTEESTLTDPILQQLAVYIRLKKQSNWSYEELDWLLLSCAANITPATKTVNEALIEALGKVAVIQDRYNIATDELSAFWYDMKTYGGTKDGLPQDLWDRVYNTPPLMADSMDSDEQAYYRPLYDGNSLFTSDPFDWTFIDSDNSQDQRISNQLAAALDISGTELAAIVNSVTTETTIELTVKNLSLMYRIARFARMLKMKTEDFITLTGTAGLMLTTADSYWSLEDIETICKQAEWLKKARLDIAQLSYLTTGIPAAGLRLPDEDTLNKALTAMTANSASVLVTPALFVSDQVTASDAQALYDQLVTAGYITAYGLVNNAKGLSADSIYATLIGDPALITGIFGGIGIRNYVSFNAGNGGSNVTFTFDPFADTTIQANNSFTMSLWVKPAQTVASDWYRILGNAPKQENGEKSPSIYQNPYAAGGIQLCYGYDNNFYTAYVDNVFENTTDWVFLSWVNDNGVWRFYRNGILAPFTGATSPGNPQGIYYQTTDPTYDIGSSFTGGVSNVSIWNTVRTADEVQQDMLAYSYENEDGLSTWWPMNEGTGTVINNDAAVDSETNGLLSGQYAWGITTSAKAKTESEVISGILQNMLAAQWAQVVQSLAPVQGVSVILMTGICSLSSTETAFAANMLIDPEEAGSTDGTTYLKVVQFNAALARSFKLTAAEISKIGAYSDKFSSNVFTSGNYIFTIGQLMQLSEYKALQSLCNITDGLISYFTEAPAQNPVVLKPTPTQVSLLAHLTGWNEQEINAIINSDCFAAINFNTINGLCIIAAVMQVESRTGMAMPSLLLLQSLSEINCFTSPDWALYDDASAAVHAALSSKKGAQAVTANNEGIRAQSRDVLCAWLIWNLQASISGVQNKQELYEYLLIDVSMSPAVKISATVAAMNSLQLYVNRCINGLEPGITNNIPKAWWQWMSTYRVWQANREVYLYPENYVDATLRKFQSTQFKTFISDVSKGQITDDNVKQALANYLESVNEIANLELIDACITTPAKELAGTVTTNEKNAVFLIGKSRSSPAVFYSRTAVAVTSKPKEEEDSFSLSEATNMQFGPWQQINLQINSDYVSTIGAFGRQFIFWVEQKEIVNTNSDHSKYTTIYATVYYSYRDLTDLWTAPAVFVKDILVEIFGSEIGPFDFYTEYLGGAKLVSPTSGNEYKYYKGRDWNQVQLQALPATSSAAETILVTLGDLVSCPVAVTDGPTKGATSLTPKAAQDYQHMLYSAAKRAFNFKEKYTTIVPAYTLNSAMQAEAWNLSMDTAGADYVDYVTISAEQGNGIVFFAAAPASSKSVHTYDTAPQPDGYWPMILNLQLVAGTTIKSVYTDTYGSFSAVPAALTGTTPGHDALQPALFNGSLYADIPWGAYQSLNQFTVSCWVYLKGNSGTAPNQNLLSMIISWPPENGGTFLQGGWDMSVHQGKFQFGIGKSGGESYSNAFGNAQTNQWYFLALTVNANGSLTATINDQQYTINATYVTIPSTTAFGLILGKSNGSNYSYSVLNGSIANLKIWKEPLTASALAAEYSAMGLWNAADNTGKLTRIGNSGAGFLYNQHRQSYIVLPDFETSALTDVLHPVYHKSNQVLQVSFNDSPVPSDATVAMKFIRINTDTLPTLMRALSTRGIGELLKPSMQYLPEEKLSLVSPDGNILQPESDLMNFNGAFSVYFWEIFFYAPYLIAEKLRANNQYAAAEKWFKYIFDPGAQNGPAGFWPLNNTINGKFPDLNTGLPASYTGLTPPAAKISVPFAYDQREVWVFNPASTPKVQAPNSDVLNPSHFTLSAWINMNAMPTSGSPFTIVNFQGGNYNGYHVYLQYVDATHCNIIFVIGTASGWVNSKSENITTASLGQWIYITATYDGNHLLIYANGKDVTSVKSSSTGLLQNTSGTFRIGCGNSSGPGAWYFNGMIADIMLNAYAMTHGEIKRLYKDYKNFGINAAYWNFRPFRRINATSLYHILNGDAWEDSFFQPASYYSASLQMAVYEYDPFDPDTIARLRVNSWQKATFMRYIENLLNWGDALFTQDTWESLSDASMRYVLVETLLGRTPVKEVSEDPQATVTYQQIAAEYADGKVPPFLIEMENNLSVPTAPVSLEQQVQSIVDAYFCIPTNKKLLGYWQLVADRLFKLRHGLTITGAPNNIPLYAPAIDPAALMAASASGSTSSILSAPVPSVPWFRFSYMINQAKSVVAEASRLGSELLAALEKKDAEQLALMQAGYQEVIFTMTARIRASQVNQLHYIGAGLQTSYANAEHVRNTYRDWMDESISPLEGLSLILSEISIAMNLVMPDFDALAGIAYLLPDIFGLADGGMNFGASTESAAKAIQTFAHVSGLAGQMTTQMAQYVRREQEWSLQRSIADNQMKEIQAQIKANDFALQAAMQEASLNNTQLQQSQEVYHFLKTKFTNTELYDWMAGQLSSLYFQMFQLAWSLAQNAQTALQYELNLNQSYLNPASWNAAYQGLLAADSLSLALQQMENAYINGNKRHLEIRKTWSMRQNDPQALLTLVSTGSCRFDLSELCYDLDFPGHYNRKIKSLSVTIPAVVGPYQNIHATLVQTGNVVCVNTNVAAVEYLFGLTSTAPADGALRANWNPNQEIIISSGINDAGVFQVNFNDEQYLPFEGTGAVSSWSLDIPQAANGFPLRSISDIIITVDYTAEDGGSTYAAQITALSPLSNYQGRQYLSMRQLYSAAWFNFCNNPVNDSYALPFELVAQMYPANLDPATLMLCNESGEIGLVPVLQEGYGGSMPQFYMYSASDLWQSSTALVQVAATAAQQPVPGKGHPWTLYAQNLAGVLVDGKIDQTKLQDIILLIPFSGTLRW